jgi:hypothetical protein
VGIKKPAEAGFVFRSGEGGIRTPGPLQVNGFQDRRDRPLCHLSFGTAKIEKFPKSSGDAQVIFGETEILPAVKSNRNRAGT